VSDSLRARFDVAHAGMTNATASHPPTIQIKMNIGHHPSREGTLDRAAVRDDARAGLLRS
jgi:hypothetical protein